MLHERRCSTNGAAPRRCSTALWATNDAEKPNRSCPGSRGSTRTRCPGGLHDPCAGRILAPVATFLFTLALFGLIVLGMAVGVMVGGKRLTGSCGGISGSCSCSSAKQRECQRKGLAPHADTPIDPSALARK